MSAPRSGLPHPEASRAVLVGVSEYRSLEQLPAVGNNLATLRQVITDVDLWGLPDEHCTVLLNPTAFEEVMDAVHTAASAASDALLFYFAGHGLLDDRSDLFLALPESDQDRLYRAVRYDDIRREVVSTARACYGKVVILDCCYSGRALQGGMSGPVDLADHARVDGTYLMTASAETSLALAPVGEDYTAFTGALVDKLAHGVPDGPDLLDMETLFYHVRADLQARRFPVPQQRTRNDGKAIALVRNRRGSGRRTEEAADVPTRELPRPPVGLEPLLRRRPADMYAEVRALRANGQERFAKQVLAASAALRADQEVAAIIELLRRQGPADIRVVITAAAQRPAVEVLRIIDALHEIGLPTEAVDLVRAVGTGRVADVATLAHLLQAGRRGDELIELLDAALDTAQARSSLIGLVNALWVAGLREEVDGLIDRAVSKLPGPAVVALADELRAVGRQETAFGLYAASARTVATRPPVVVAQLCQAMADAGRGEDSGRLAGAVIEGAEDVGLLLEIVSAFWDTDQGSHADLGLTRAAAVLPVADVVFLAAELRARDHDEAAYALCLRAMVARPAAAIQEIITALREEGRPVDAGKLLDEVAGRVPPRTVLDLLDLCAEADHQRVLRKVIQRTANEVAEVLDALVAGRSVVAGQLRNLIASSDTLRGKLLPISIQYMNPKTKEKVFADIVHTGHGGDIARSLRHLPVDDAKLLMFLAVRAGNPTFASIIDALGSAPDSSGDPALRFLLDQPVDRLTTLLDGLRAAHFEAYARAVLGSVTAPQRGVQAIARDVAFLFGAGESHAAKLVVFGSLKGRSNSELKNMIGALRQHDQPESLAAAAEWARATYSSLGAANVDGILRQIGLDAYTSRRGLFRRRRKDT
ncbi:caspase, EACC1-associated type [Actinophytocola sediminis]